MEGMIQKFEPKNPQYEKVSDLPKNQQADFADAKGGFVRKEAIANYNRWEKEAKEANKGRSIFKKIFMVGKQTALDIAHEEAREETEDDLLLESEMLKSLNDIMPEMISLIETGIFESIISEESSGRLSSEVMKRIIERIYQKNNIDKKITIFPLYINRKTSHPHRYVEGGWLKSWDIEEREMKDAQRQQEREKINKWFENEEMGAGTLYVTEFISSGHSIKMGFDFVSEAISRAKYQDKKIPELYCFVAMGSSNGGGRHGDEVFAGNALSVDRRRPAGIDVKGDSWTDRSSDQDIFKARTGKDIKFFGSKNSYNVAGLHSKSRGRLQLAERISKKTVDNFLK